MTTEGIHVVLGVSGGAGNAIARALDDAGLQTRGVNRSGEADVPATVDVAAADITRSGDLDLVLNGAAVVYMAAQPAYHRWPQEFPTMLDGVIAAAARHHVKLVMVDNLYAYGPGHETLSETSQFAATDKKGRVRRRMVEMILEAHASGRIRATIGQASDYFGPRADNSGITALAIASAADSGAIRWMGAWDQPHSVAYLPDIARAYVTLGSSDAADGSAWILPHGRALSGREFAAMVNGCLPEPRKVALISGLMLRLAAPFYRISRESLGVLYQWTAPWVADDAAFQAAFGPFATTPHDVAVKTTVDWYRQR